MGLVKGDNYLDKHRAVVRSDEVTTETVHGSVTGKMKKRNFCILFEEFGYFFAKEGTGDTHQRSCDRLTVEVHLSVIVTRQDASEALSIIDASVQGATWIVIKAYDKRSSHYLAPPIRALRLSHVHL